MSVDSITGKSKGAGASEANTQRVISASDDPLKVVTGNQSDAPASAPADTTEASVIALLKAILNKNFDIQSDTVNIDMNTDDLEARIGDDDGAVTAANPAANPASLNALLRGWWANYQVVAGFENTAPTALPATAAATTAMQLLKTLANGEYSKPPITSGATLAVVGAATSFNLDVEYRQAGYRMPTNHAISFNIADIGTPPVGEIAALGLKLQGSHAAVPSAADWFDLDASGDTLLAFTIGLYHLRIANTPLESIRLVVTESNSTTGLLVNTIKYAGG
jgi:hypothetical protein